MSNILAKAEAKVKVKVEALLWICWWWWCWPNNDSSGGFSRDGAVGFVGTGGFGTTWWP